MEEIGFPLFGFSVVQLKNGLGSRYSIKIGNSSNTVDHFTCILRDNNIETISNPKKIRESAIDVNLYDTFLKISCFLYCIFLMPVPCHVGQTGPGVPSRVGGGKGPSPGASRSLRTMTTVVLDRIWVYICISDYIWLNVGLIWLDVMKCYWMWLDVIIWVCNFSLEAILQELCWFGP